MNMRLILAFLISLSMNLAWAEPVPPAKNKDGSNVSGFLTALFDLRPGQVAAPFPYNPLFDPSDLTLNIPGTEGSTDYGNPAVAMGTIDGFSTVNPWITTFSSFPNQIDPNSVVPGQSVRLFEVSFEFPNIVAPNGIVRELSAGVDFMATMASSNTLAIVPIKPLAPSTNYMAVLTNDIHDTAGNDATPSEFYHLSKSQAPWFEEGKSTSPFFDDETAADLETLRQITDAMETVAESAGIPRQDIILSWTALTQSVTPVLKHLRSIARPAPTEVAPSGQTTAFLGGSGIADIYVGVITLPYYLGVPGAANPFAPLTNFWKAAPGGYIAPFDQLGLDPTSTNLTFANPFPVKTSDQTVPLLVTVPNAKSGHQKPAAGWPVVIFGHGLWYNRGWALAIADSLAAAGYAVVAIDSPLHGIQSWDPLFGALHIGNTPWADVANERTFDVDYADNITGVPGPDGIADPSGIHFLSLTSLLTVRDNARQNIADLSVLAVTLPFIDIDGDSLPDLDASTTSYVSWSGGSIVGTAFVAIEPTVTHALLSAGMGGLARGLEASEYIGPLIRAGLSSIGVLPGTSDYDQYFAAMQLVIDAADPINWAVEAARLNNIVVHEVIDDVVLPNDVPTAPLSGTEPLIKLMGLQDYSTTLSNPVGLDAAGRFVKPAMHSSLVNPTASPAATAEMQKQMASFIASRGRTVVVEDAATMVPVPAPTGDAAATEGANE